MKKHTFRAFSLLILLCFIFTSVSCSDGQVPDVTDKLQNLGVNCDYWWKGKSASSVLSRNPYDMINYNGKIFLSGGNYCDNTGGVPLNYYQNGSDTFEKTTIIPSEQVDEFYIFDNVLYCTEVDPKEWGNADVWYYTDESGKWKSGIDVLSTFIHCYDMEKFGDSYFFCGSDDDGNSDSMPIVYRTDKAPYEAAKEDYVAVPFYDAKGKQVTHADHSELIHMNGITFRSDFTARFHDLLIFNGELYAFYYTVFRKANGHDGFYKYDAENDRFVLDETKDTSFLRDVFESGDQDDQKILHDFIYGDKTYMILNGLPDMLVCTDDLKNFHEVKVPGYDGVSIHDCVFIKGVPHLLGSLETDGGFVNYVFKTKDFENFKPIFTFKTELMARSFEYSDGVYYFGLGFNYRHDHGKVELPENAELCGTVLRYDPKKKR